jgi:hypothetical protein
MWLIAAVLLGIAAVLWIVAAGQVILGVVFLVIAAMFAIFSQTTGRGTP